MTFISKDRLLFVLLAGFALMLISFAPQIQAEDDGGDGSCYPYYGTPPTCTPPIIVGLGTLSASPNPTSAPGAATTLTWTCAEATGFSDATSGMVASSNFWSGYKGYPYTDNSEAYGGTVVVSPTETTQYWVTCTPTWNGGSTTGGSHTAYHTVTVPTLIPDLYAGNVSTVSGTVNSPVTLSATVYNQGNATATNFPNSFQISGIGYVAAQTHTLASGGSTGISASYTFTSSGSYSVLACADRNTGGTGSVAESNEDNNCSGSWVTVVIAPLVADITASQLGIIQITGGLNVLLQAVISNAGNGATNQ